MSRFAAALAAALALALAPLSPAAGAAAPAQAAPEFTHSAPAAWLNSAPLTLQSLRGQVVLLDVWTTDCWNCYRSFAWLRSVERRHGAQGLHIITVHSPEFEREKDRRGILARLAQHELGGTVVMLDDDFSYWKALGNRYWPAFYLIDRQGRIRHRLVGEQHEGQPGAVQFEATLRELIAER